MKCIIIHEITDKIIKTLHKNCINFSVEDHTTIVTHANVQNPKSCSELVKHITFEGITVDDGKLKNNHNKYMYNHGVHTHGHIKPNHNNIVTCLDMLKTNSQTVYSSCCTYPDCSNCKFKDQIKPVQWR